MPPLSLRLFPYSVLLFSAALGPLMPLTPAFAQTGQAPLQCNIVRQQQSEQHIQTLLEQTRQGLQTRQIDQTIRSLQQALQMLQAVEPPEQKANLLRSITEIANSEPPAGPLVETVTLVQKTDQAEALLPLLSQTEQIALSLPGGYTSARITALVAIARHYTILGHPDRATSPLSLAEKAVPNLQGREVQTKALTTIAQEYARLGQPTQGNPLLDQAWILAQRLPAEANLNDLRYAWVLEPIAITYAKFGSFDQAFAVAEKIPTSVAEGFYHDNTIAQVAVQYAPDQRSQALDRIRQLKRLDIRAGALMQIAKAEWDSGTTRPALDLLNETRALLPQVDNPDQRPLLLGQLAQQYAYLGDLDTGLAMTASIPEVRLRVLAQTGIALNLSEANSQVVMTTLQADLQAVPDPVMRDMLREEVINQFIDAQRYASALQLIQAAPEDDLLTEKPGLLSRMVETAVANSNFELAEQAAEAIPESWTDYHGQSWRAIALAHAKAGNEIQTAQAVGKISNYGSLVYQVRTLAEISEIYRNTGKAELGQQALDRALEITRGFDTNLQLTDGLSAIALQYTKLGKPEQAATLRAEALQIAARATDTSTHDSLLRGMVQQFLDARQYEAALDIVSQYHPDSGERDQIYYQVLDAMIQGGQLEQARQATVTVPAPAVRTRLLLAIADRYLQQDQSDRALETLDQALTVAKTIPGPESNTISVREDLQIDDAEARGNMLSAIALKYATAGDSSKARAIAATLQSQSIRDPLIQQINCLD